MNLVLGMLVVLTNVSNADLVWGFVAVWVEVFTGMLVMGLVGLMELYLGVILDMI